MGRIKKKSAEAPRQDDSPATDNASAPAPGSAPAPHAAADLQRPAFEDSEPPAATPDPALAGLFSSSPGAGVAELAGGVKGSREAFGKQLDEMTVVELYALRQEVDSRLPPRTLTEVDLVEELLLQYQIAKSLLASVLGNLGTPANQKAQVQNSCATILEQVTKTQTKLYDAERIKAMEAALEKTFATVAQDKKEAFYERYAQLVREEAQRRERKAGN